MARTLDLFITQEKNAVESVNPFLWCFEFDDPGNFPAPIRFVSDLETLTFQGSTYDPFPVAFDSIDEVSIEERQNTRASIANTDEGRQLLSLLETRWLGVVDPEWTLRVWRVLHSVPDSTPFASAAFFQILSVTVDMLLLSFELESARLPSNALETGRRYNRSQFPHIPRIL